MERGAWTKLGVGDRVVASAVCVLTGAALIWVVWCFVELEGPVALSAVLFAGSVLPRALQLVYVATFGGAAIAVGRYRVSSFVLLLHWLLP